MRKFNSHKLFAIASILVLLSACAATHTAINKSSLDVQTKMSDTIFLTPATSHKKIAYVQIKNTSDKQQLDINAKVCEAIAAKGYQIVQDPDQANYWVQGNVLQVGQVDLRNADVELQKGYGSAMNGAITGGVIGALAGDNPDSMLLGGLIGSGISTVGNALVKDISYSIVTDIQVSEKIDGLQITEKQSANLSQGKGTRIKSQSTETTDMKKYQTRILSTANKVNLKFDDAAPELIAGLSNAIAGLM